MLIRNLPADSATIAAIHGPQAAWGVTDYLVANVVDLLAGANWQRSGKGRRPKPLPRPKSAEETRRKHEQMTERMERMAQRNAEWRARRERGE